MLVCMLCILVRRSVNHGALQMITLPLLDLQKGVMTVECSEHVDLFSV